MTRMDLVRWKDRNCNNDAVYEVPFYMSEKIKWTSMQIIRLEYIFVGSGRG